MACCCIRTPKDTQTRTLHWGPHYGVTIDIVKTYFPVENPRHSDFTKLRTMLISTHMQDLKDVTQDVHYENFRAQCISQISQHAMRERGYVTTIHSRGNEVMSQPFIHEGMGVCIVVSFMRERGYGKIKTIHSWGRERVYLITVHSWGNEGISQLFIHSGTRVWHNYNYSFMRKRGYVTITTVH